VRRPSLLALVACLALAGCQGEYGGVAPSATCDNLDAMVLMAQAVPGAEQLPCVVTAVHEDGEWYLPNMRTGSGLAAFSYTREGGFTEKVEVSLRHECDTAGATEIPSDEEPARRYERVELVGERYVGSRYYVFDGGCVVYDFDLSEEGRSRLINDVTLALGLRSRESVVQELDQYSSVRGREL
jgi:hypothetical protein